MKKIAFVLLIIALVTVFVFGLNELTKSQPTTKPKLTRITPKISPLPRVVSAPESNFLFVPYWSFEKEINSENSDQLIYFGVTATENGIDENELGFKNLKSFNSITADLENKFLAVRLLDSRVNSKILEDDKLQTKIISQSIEIAKANNFRGIVLDFEISSLSFESVVKNISLLYGSFYKQTKNNNLLFLTALYGDVFYRLRPFDVKNISQNSDGILVMAYDFHKAKGNPGPNFPLNGKEKYGYDLTKMLDDFLQIVPPKKLIIVFGLFGYDWQIDDQGQAVARAESLSLNQLRTKFLTNCQFNDCQMQKDKESSETQISYRDQNQQKHVVWFEDLDSIKEKKKYFKEKGINSFGLWAYSFF